MFRHTFSQVRLQSVMNAAAWLIFCLQSFTVSLRSCVSVMIQWLNRFQLCSPRVHLSSASYLIDELCHVADVDARQRLRSSSFSSPIVSSTNARVWNSLPEHVTSAPQVPSESPPFCIS